MQNPNDEQQEFYRRANQANEAATKQLRFLLLFTCGCPLLIVAALAVLLLLYAIWQAIFG